MYICAYPWICMYIVCTMQIFTNMNLHAQGSLGVARRRWVSLVAGIRRQLFPPPLGRNHCGTAMGNDCAFFETARFQSAMEKPGGFFTVRLSHPHTRALRAYCWSNPSAPAFV